MDSATPQASVFVRLNPLAPAAVLLLLGVMCGRWLTLPVWQTLAAAGALWVAWLALDGRAASGRRVVSQIALGAAIVVAGVSTWQLNQRYVPRTHVARFVPGSEEVAVTARLRVLAAPDAAPQHGDRYWLGRVSELLTTDGWIPATGDVLVAWRSGPGAIMLRRGELVEAYGWAARPAGAMNPGAIDPRAMLAADRIFVTLRVPRAGGIVPRDASAATGPDWLTRMRLYLRGKLLEHTLPGDVPAALTMQALLLGYRDPGIADISKAFTDAGVAHLLAISGSHIVFFAWVVWCVLRFLPLRPRWREVIIGLVVMAYVLATPCGPPIVRAAVGLAVLVVSRVMGRPHQAMNMVAAAAIIVVLLRPVDIGDAGCQLSFAATAGLVLFSEPLYHGLFGRRLARERLVADLAGTAWARWRFRSAQVVCAALVANIIGATTAAPLVAYHFSQVNAWSPLTGMVALPVVSLAMVMAALQLLAEVCWSPLGAALSPISTLSGHAMVWLVQKLAALPGAAMAVRSPPVWAPAAFYGVLLLWAARRRLGMSRAMVVNAAAAVLALTVGWYTLTAPVGSVTIQVLDAGQGSCVVLRGPDGRIWLIDAGSQDRASLLHQAIEPAMRVAGERRLNGMVATALDVRHARSAGAAVAEFAPRDVLVAEADWADRHFTLAGTELDAAVASGGTRVRTLTAGNLIRLGEGCQVEILEAPRAEAAPPRDAMILLLQFAGRQVLMVDPTAGDSLEQVELARPSLRCDAVILTGPQRGAADEAMRRLLEPLGESSIIWSGRGSWADRLQRAGELNAADGAVTIHIDRAGGITVGR